MKRKRRAAGVEVWADEMPPAPGWKWERAHRLLSEQLAHVRKLPALVNEWDARSVRGLLRQIEGLIARLNERPNDDSHAEAIEDAVTTAALEEQVLNLMAARERAKAAEERAKARRLADGREEANRRRKEKADDAVLARFNKWQHALGNGEWLRELTPEQQVERYFAEHSLRTLSERSRKRIRELQRAGKIPSL